MNNLLVGDIKKHYFKYVIPSIAGSLAYGLLIFIDTVFIGRGIGAIGIAALNIAIPVFSLVAFGMTLGVGGATLASINEGRNELEGKNLVFSTALISGVVFSLIFTILSLLYLDKLVSFLGGKGEVFFMTREYLSVISKSIIFYIIPHILTNFIKNDYNPKLPTLYSFVVSIVNLVLDYLFIFVFKLGMGGAALATSIAQGLGTALLFSHFRHPLAKLKFRYAFSFPILINIIKVGLPSFITEISLGAVLIIANYQFYHYLGNTGISAYGIIYNINLLIYLVYSGISQGAQPIISINFGAKNRERILETFKIGFKLSLILGVIIYITLYIFKTPITLLFNNSDLDVIALTKSGIPLYFITAIFMGLNLKLGSFFQSISYSKVSNIITFLRSSILIVIFLIFLPKFIGVSGLWLAFCFSELVTLLVGIYFYKIYFLK